MRGDDEAISREERSYKIENILMDINNKKPGVGFGVMILKQGRILLGKRHSDPDKADSELHGEGTWTMPGGKLL